MGNNIRGSQISTKALNPFNNRMSQEVTNTVPSNQHLE